MIFRNESTKVGGDYGNILLRVGDSCATNCYNCNSSSDSVSYVAYHEFTKVITYISKQCDHKLHLFLYGVEVLYHPDIHAFLTDKFLSKFPISIHITPLYAKERIDSIFQLGKQYQDISFDTCYTIKDKQRDVLHFFYTLYSI